jgi:ferritin-like protein
LNIKLTKFIILLSGRRNIQALRVKCTKYEEFETFQAVCGWEGTFGELEDHDAKCGCVLVPCPKACRDESGKVKQIPRQKVDQHQDHCPNRDHTCESCGEKATYTEITEVHDGICDMKLIPCPNECLVIVPRKDMEEHVENECEYTVISCKYENIGCKREMKREKMAAHEQDDKLHLHVALNAILRLQDANADFHKSLTELHDITAGLQDANADFHKSLTELYDITAGLQDANADLHESLVELRDTTAGLQVKTKTLNHGESLTFAVNSYEARKKEKITFACEPFYTHPNGYHMIVDVYAHGCYGDGTHITVSASLLQGKHDSTLPWPFLGKLRVSLLNQLEDKNHYTGERHVDSDDDAVVSDRSFGFPEYISHSMLAYDEAENIQYLKDDMLYFRVEVDVADHKHWLNCTT